ncbi:acyl-CoA dehydrogenase [Mycobacterium sp. Root265]|uniref:phosphotransferase family protein n=1 Tax=Mycobacterium sp. Root265 TaxID=1736504 RepID=UPI00070A072B|nr:phosphotransferase family protein [Mycobacterium sp. Root265]KRD05756.1 acyl-CoA dehydrogenase [Mycobacterium sp. Root265]
MTTTAEALDLEALARHFDDIGVAQTGPLRSELISGGRSNLTFLIFDDKSTWVLRRRPLQGVTPSAHDMGREYRVVQALSDTGIPVARPVTLCEDDSVLGAPFAVVEYVMGQVIRTSAELAIIDTDSAVRDCAYGLVDVLASLHAVDPDSVGLGDFGRRDGYLQRQIRRWSGQWDLVRHPDDSRDAEVHKLHQLLAESVPVQSDTSIVHGDYRIDNTILENGAPHRVRAVVDWEMSTLGDPLADAALMCVYREPVFNLVIGADAAWTSPRMPSAEDMAQRYALTSGRDLQHWEFHLAAGYFKVAIIAAGIAYRRRTLDGTEDAADDAVAPLIAKGLQLLSGAG